MKDGSGGNLGLSRDYPKELFGPMFYSWWNCPSITAPNELYFSIAHSFTKQLLSSEGLSLSWMDTIMAVTREVCERVRPDVRHEKDDMDIRQYVQIKKVSSRMRFFMLWPNT